MGVGAMKEGVQMGLKDVSQMENGVTLEFRLSELSYYQESRFVNRWRFSR